MATTMTASSSNSNNIHQSLGGGNSSQPPSKASSPASPTASFQTQQVPPSRSFINLKSSGRPTLNSSSFPATPTSERSNTTIASINTPSTSALDPPPGTTYADFVRIWSDAHVARWLTDIKCGSHTSTFKNNDIRGDVLLELDQVTLKEMGINSIGDRFRIVNAVKVLRQRCSTRSTLSLPLFDVAHPRGYDGIGGRGESLSISSYGQPITHNRSDSLTESSPSIRRRLENGRPPPLHLNSTTTRSDLPRLVSDGLDSAKSGHHAFRPLPQHPQSPSSNTPSSSTRPGLPPPAPPPRTHPPPPPLLPLPLGPGNRSTPGRLQPSNNQRSRTPTQPDPPSYVNMPLPPAPGPAGQQQNSMTPTTATSQGSSSGNWSGSGSGYGLPPDPRPGGKVLVRNPVGTRSPNPNAAHHRNMSFAGVNSPLATTPTGKARPNTANTNSSSHPYASETARSQALQAPTPAQLQAMSLSPIAESFVSTRPGSPSPPTPFTVGRGPFTTTRPMTPSHAAAPSLDDLRRKLVRFLLPEEGHSCTINAEDCSGGIEVLEKVLKKFNKLGSGDRDIMDLVEIENGGLSVDGWGVYLDWGQGGKPLTEAEILSICHAPPDNPARERGLTLRRSTKSKRPKALGQWLGGNNQRANSPTSPTILPTGEPDRDGNLLSPHHANANKSFEEGQTKAMNTKRASSISILSGLGVPYPEKALEPSSPTTSTGGRKSPASNHKRPSKLRNFFGQRPPSELITTHLAEYFPFTEKKVLERTARNSMMRSSTIGSIGKRDSTMSWNPALPLSSSRFSSSTQGDVGSISPRTSFSSTAPPPVPDKTSPFTGERTPVTEEPPRMSLSTDDGRSIDLDPEESEKPPRLNSIPQLLPPVNISSESFSESIENLTGGRRRSRPASGAFSIASKRMSYMTELRSKRDVSDTASLVTVDEITASVESRRESMAIDRATDSADEWTKIGSDEDTNVADSSEQTAVEDDYTSEEYESDEQDALSEDDDDCGPGKAVTSKGGTKWIKGALIGAGSFGKVYLGMDASNGLLMAVKQVELPTGSAPNEERKKSMLSALEREIDLLKDLQHENIVQYLYSSLDDDYLNIFLEYVPGGSVTALLRNYGAFEEPLVKNFVRQILQGLNYLHERDIIHRDIKGANILVDNKGGIKISDFGISKKVGDNLLGKRVNRPSLQGSVFWMAPEVVKQTAHTRKADIWSVGCLVVEMLTGEHPWAQLTQMQAIFKIGSSAKPTIPSDISAEAQDFLLKTFDLDHEARPGAGELLQHPWIATKKSQSASKGNALKATPAIEITA